MFTKTKEDSAEQGSAKDKAAVGTPPLVLFNPLEESPAAEPGLNPTGAKLECNSINQAHWSNKHTGRNWSATH